jgi:gamma-glutamyltranspeptidase / glutathione hydrolase
VVSTLLAGCGGGDETGIVGTVRGFAGGVVADEPRAAQIGADMLSAGGTAADAAADMYFTLAVTLPSTATLGGGGVCVMYDAKLNRGQILDFAPRAPAGGGPVAIPAGARGMFALHGQYGKLRWEQIVGPAEGLARLGAPVSRAFAADLLAAQPILAADPELAKIYLHADGSPYTEGQLLVQRDLSTVLSAIRTRGAGDFYSGPAARQFIEGASKHGAKITADDLRNAAFGWRPAVAVPTGERVAFFPSPPAVGGVLEGQMWAMMAPRWSRAAADERPHLFAQASVRAWLDRQRWLGPDFKVTPSAPEVVDEAHAKALMASYQPGQRTLPAGLKPPADPGADDAAAASFVAVDREGNAVSCMVSPYGLFGAGHVATGTGIVLAAAPDEANGRGPQWLGPMIVVREGEASIPIFSSFKRMNRQQTGTESAGSQVVFAGAASGGAAAASALIEVALRAVVEERPLDEAMDAVRLHVEGASPDRVFVEAGVQARLPGLAERGYKVTPIPVIGRVEAVSCPDGVLDKPQTCSFRADRRGFGLAVGGF